MIEGYVILGVIIIMFLVGFYVGQALGESIANRGFGASKQVVRSVTGAVVAVSLASTGAYATHQIYASVEKQANISENSLATPTSISSLQVVTLSPNSQLPSECAQLNLTPEEMANCGTHTYRTTGCTVTQGDSGSCHCGEKSDFEISTLFLDPNTVQFTSDSGNNTIYHKNASNIYIADATEIVDNETYQNTYTIIFNEHGFQSIALVIPGNCTWTYEREIIK